MILELKEIKKSYSVNKKEKKVILNCLNLKVEKGESIAIKGRSGSGKTTLLNILTGMDINFSGEYLFFNNQIAEYSDSERAKFRREEVGIITQHFNLLDDRNIYENIAIALSHQKLNKKEKKKLVAEALQYVGLENTEKKLIKQLSGGEMQRIAIARAIIKKPKLIIADEPTGALDESTRDEILNIFQRMMERGHQFIIVTHDEVVAEICDKSYVLKNGVLRT